MKTTWKKEVVENVKFHLLSTKLKQIHPHFRNVNKFTHYSSCFHPPQRLFFLMSPGVLPCRTAVASAVYQVCYVLSAWVLSRGLEDPQLPSEPALESLALPCGGEEGSWISMKQYHKHYHPCRVPQSKRWELTPQPCMLGYY